MTDPTPQADSPPRHRAQLDSEEIQARRAILLKLTVAAIIPAMVVSGWGMWTFFHDLGKLPWFLILPMFLLFDLAAIACAWGARINRIAYGRMGIEGWLVWLFAIASGLMSASDADGRESAVRFAAPMVAAILFELLIRGERRDLTQHDGPIARIRRRIMARAGLLDDVDQDDETAAVTRMAAKLATLAFRAHETPDGSRRRTWAVRRYHRRLRIANERMGFATNDDMVDQVRLHLDALYSSMSGTSASAVADLNVWQAEPPPAPEPAPIVKVATFAQAAAPEFTFRPARIGGSRRPRRTGRLAGHVPTGKRAQPAVAPVPAGVPLKPEHVAALRDHGYDAASLATVRIPGEASFAEGAQIIADTAPPPPATRRKPTRQSPAKVSRKGRTEAAADNRAILAAYLRDEKAKGRTPTKKQIVNETGLSRATVYRYLPELEGAAS